MVGGTVGGNGPVVDGADDAGMHGVSGMDFVRPHLREQVIHTYFGTGVGVFTRHMELEPTSSKKAAKGAWLIGYPRCRKTLHVPERISLPWMGTWPRARLDEF